MGLFSFITAPLSVVAGTIGSVITAGKRKKTAQIQAQEGKAQRADAAKQRAHELKMANLAASQQVGKPKQTQMILLIGGGIAVIGFLFLKKRR